MGLGYRWRIRSNADRYSLSVCFTACSTAPKRFGTSASAMAAEKALSGPRARRASVRETLVPPKE